MSNFKFHNKNILSAVSLFSFVYLIITNLIHLYNYFYLSNSVTFSRFFSKDISVKDVFESFVMCFFVLFSLRIIMGIIFLKEDPSLNSKPKNFNEFSEEEIKKYNLLKEREGAQEFLIGAPIILSALILNHTLWDSSFDFIMRMMIFINVLIIIFNVIFFEKLFKRDVEKKANIFIAIGDFVAIVITVLLLCFKELYDSKFFYILIGGFLLVFIGETITQYGQSIYNAFKELKNTITNYIDILKKKINKI